MEEGILSLTAEYIREVKEAVSEAHKRDLFAHFVRSLYGKDQDIRVEESVDFKGVYAGRIDLSVDGVLFEFKKDITSKGVKRKALQELKKYLSSDQYKHSPFGIITDGLRFEVYERGNFKTPIDSFSFPEEEENTEAIREALYRLDRYLLAPFRVPLTSERVIDVLGYNSTFFRSIYRKLIELYKRVQEDRDVKLKLKEWEVYMSFVYGRELEEDLFFRHTYLSMVVKILCVRLLGLGSPQDVGEVLSGEFFERSGIRNYIERDFYSWIFHPSIEENVREIGELIFHTLSSKFEFEGLSDELEEDTLKELYQNIVTRAERQLLGEYYTPDWLVQEILEEVLKDTSLKLLDPSCGSGSFLFFAIKKKKQQHFKSSQEKLEHILDTVAGIDINPLAVLIAKTNYLIALGELLRDRERDIYLPVYSADSLLAFLEPSQRELFGNSIKIKVDGVSLDLPRHEDTELIDKFIDIAIDYALNPPKRGNFYHFLSGNYPEEEDVLKLERGFVSLYKVAESIKTLIQEKGDSIWAFIFKNIYKPLFFKNSFDAVVGNPPWLVFNRMHAGLQSFVREFMKENGINVGGHLVSHIDIAFIFLLSCFMNYLKDDGTIAFVLPYSLLSGDQNAWLRKRQRYGGRSLEILKVYDLKDVQPLFNVPSCVLIGKKTRRYIETQKEIPAVKFKGKLPKTNADIGTAQRYLTKEKRTLYFVEAKNKSYWTYDPSAHFTSEYAEGFKEGATIVPRSFWFVEREETPLGYSRESVPIVSKDTGDEKLKATIRGSAPERFFFKTLLSKRMYPFGFTFLDEIVLPLEVVSSSDEAVEDIEHSIKKVREWIREYEEGIDDTADADAHGAFINLLCSADEYMESEEVSVEAKRRIAELLWENRDLIEYFGIGGKEDAPQWWWRSWEVISRGGFDIYEPVEEPDKLRERFKYRLLDYYDVLSGKELGSATDKFYYWIESTAKVPKNFKDWLIKCQKIWEEWRGEKAKSHNIIDWLNYRNKLTQQPVKGGYLVLYTTSGSNPCACVVENAEKFVVDHKTYYARFDNLNEALYLTSFINSQVLSSKIRDIQSQGLFGARDIHKLIVQQPIPKYYAKNPLHRELVRVAKKAQEKANREEIREYLKEVHPNRIRSEGRHLLEFELNQIDRLVAEILEEEKPPQIERLCLFIHTDIEKEKLTRRLRSYLKERGIEPIFKTLPPKVARIKYDLDSLNPEEFSLAIGFLSQISRIKDALPELLKEIHEGIQKAVSIFRTGEKLELREY